MTGRVALIGVGAMGGAIGPRLVATGRPLRVFDLDAAKGAVLVAGWRDCCGGGPRPRR